MGDSAGHEGAAALDATPTLRRAAASPLELLTRRPACAEFPPFNLLRVSRQFQQDVLEILFKRFALAVKDGGLRSDLTFLRTLPSTTIESLRRLRIWPVGDSQWRLHWFRSDDRSHAEFFQFTSAHIPLQNLFMDYRLLVPEPGWRASEPVYEFDVEIFATTCRLLSDLQCLRGLGALKIQLERFGDLEAPTEQAVMRGRLRVHR